MKKKKDLTGYKATVSRLRTLLLRERVVSGTLNVQAVGNARRYTLTDKVGGKTRCLYVPVSMEAEVRRYAQNWRELKSLMLEMSEWTRRLLAEEIAAATGRGAGAGKGGRKGATGAGRKAAGKSAGRRSRSAT
ncbi:MAG: hypothetical protein IJR99_16775 [Kiritimatiellae bacterium]|nr:hypothetical protein [Kiritimatiellia bacterium]